MTSTQKIEVCWSYIYGDCNAAYPKITAAYTAETRGTLFAQCVKLQEA